MKFLARFQRLERARARSAGAPGPEAERFAALESAAPLPEVHPPPSGRFALPDAPLELDRTADAQPFVRCQACGRDSQRGTVRCGCGARLDSAEVVEFNALLWADLQARRREENAEHQQALARDLAEAERLTAERRALGEELARQVGDQERRRLDASSGLPRWAWWIVVPVLAVAIIGARPGAALILGVLVLGVLGWWWQRRPPGP